MKNKKYWYLKLESDFFNRHDIKYLLSSEVGVKAVMVYETLMLESISHEGRLRFNKDKPYTLEMIHNIFFSAYNNLDETRQCFKELETMDLIKWEKDKTLYIKGVEERVGTTTEQANYMSDYRRRKVEENLQESLQCKPPVRNCKKNVITNVSLDIEKEIEKDIDIEIDSSKEKKIKKEKNDKETLKNLLTTLQMMFGNRISSENSEYAIAMFNKFGYDTTLDTIKMYIDKNNPIGYAHAVLCNQSNGFYKMDQLEDEGTDYLRKREQLHREGKL